MIWRSWRSQVLGPGPKADPWIPKGRWVTGQFGQKSQEQKVKKPKEAEMEVDGDVCLKKRMLKSKVREAMPPG